MDAIQFDSIFTDYYSKKLALGEIIVVNSLILFFNALLGWFRFFDLTIISSSNFKPSLSRCTQNSINVATLSNKKWKKSYLNKDLQLQ